MRTTQLAWNAVLALALVPVPALVITACGGGESGIDLAPDDSGPPDDDDDDRDRRDSGTAGRAGNGGRGGAGGGRGGSGGSAGTASDDAGMDAALPDTAAPVIEMLAPAEADDPNVDEIITETVVRARCRVTRSPEVDARDVDQSSVAIRMSVPGHPEILPVDGAVNALADNEFEAEFTLGDLPNGRLLFECSAADVSARPVVATASVETFLDLGPNIVILEPVDMSIHALTTPVLVKFEVQPDPVDELDEEAAYANLRLEVIGREFAAMEDPSQDGLYSVNINFNDQTLFAMPPTTAEIRVTATSSRTPNAPTRRRDSAIEIDAEGPSITINRPTNLSIVRGEVELRVTISDPSGIQPNSLMGTINNGQYVLSDWEQISATVFREQFDTRADMFDQLVQLTINLWVNDTVGNQSTVAHVLRLDNVPPILSLDPPRIREWRTVSNQRRCSDHFDPVGDAASDLDTVLASSMYRVLVEDRTNTSPGAAVEWHSGVDATTMRLYAQKNEAIPLLVDGDDDGICDAINFEDLPLADRPVELRLSPVPDGGASFFSNNPDFGSPLHTASPSCMGGTATTPPNELCLNTTMTRSLPSRLESAPPALYAFAPMNNELTCTGDTWELLSSVGEGWTCLAARVEDNIDNVGISAPIRVCVDDLTGPPPTCLDRVADPPPDCADDCAWPDDFPPNMEWRVH